MEPTAKAEWIAALRSGNYSQAQGTLKTLGNYFCCLGVLCDLSAKKSLGSWQPSGNFVYEGAYISTSLPIALRLKLGIACTEQDTLIKMNDKESKSFNEIADYIEKEL